MLASVRPAQTATAVRLVKDIFPSGGSSIGSFPYFTAVGDRLFFEATDGRHGRELWRSDGTAAGTAMVKDINPAGDASLYDLTAVGETLFFFATDSVHGVELWRSDGSAAGTTMVKDINPTDGNDSSPRALTAFNDTLFFRADDNVHYTELWKSDGTEAGTVMVKDINRGAATYPCQTNETARRYNCPSPPPRTDSDPASFAVVGGTLFFTAVDAAHGRELWSTDGSEAGTRLVKDIKPDGSGSFEFVPSFAVVGDTLFFSPANDGVHGPELWRSDGTEAGTRIVKDIWSGGHWGWGYPYWLTNMSGGLFFSADDGVHGIEVWRSDGTAAGTAMLKDINPGETEEYPANHIVMANALFFHADDGAHGRELWVSDGTAAGTTMLKDINPGARSALTLGELPEIRVVDDTLFFAADDGIHSVELWASDGTAAGTRLVQDINDGDSGSHPYEFTRIGTSLYFAATTAATGRELWALELPYHQVYLPLTAR